MSKPTPPRRRRTPPRPAAAQKLIDQAKWIGGRPRRAPVLTAEDLEAKLIHEIGGLLALMALRPDPDPRWKKVHQLWLRYEQLRAKATGRR